MASACIKRLFLAFTAMTVGQIATADIIVPTYECIGGEATQIAESTLSAYNDQLMLSEYDQPTDDHIILVTNLDAATWMTLSEAENFCAAPEFVTAARCSVRGDISTEQLVAGDVVKMAELGVDRFAPENGQRIAIDPTGTGRWTNETDAQLDEICVAQDIIELTKYYCTPNGDIQTFTQNGTRAQLEAWNYLPDMPANATGLYYDNRGTTLWSVLSPLEMAVICEGSVASEARNGTWEIDIADFDAGSCPAEVLEQAQAQMAGGPATRDIIWPSPWSPTPLLDDSTAMGGPWRRDDTGWTVTMVDIEQQGVNVRVGATLSVINPERIEYTLVVNMAPMNCRAEINAIADWVGE